MTIKWLQSKILKALYGALLGLILTGLLGAFPDNVFAACSGNGCNGKDANTEGCTGISTRKEVRPPTLLAPPGNGYGAVQLRYSTSCNAKWARTVNMSTSTAFAAATSWWPPYAYPANLQYSKSSAAYIAIGDTSYARMLGPSYPVQACGKVSWGLTPIAVPITQSSSPYCTIFN